ncbi:MAG: GIY-YIG nuclease family protein [Planctomycetes bacterium]|nr:excinuclease ABC subunit UvrC [Phycisphaerae bacterium]NBB96271.1 GIY-YIG nuclease family protein [Planctomycetota bacterium]
MAETGPPRKPRTTILADLRHRIAELPHVPGVYLLKDAKGIVLYIGKAKDLRSRVSSYFQPGANLASNRGPDIERMVRTLVTDIDVLECDSEVDALLRENRLIKDIQPRFNDRQKDGKTFPYLQITTDEQFPRVSISRQPKPRGAKLYGPFIHAYDLRQALPLMQRVFKFRTCKLDLDPGEDDKRRYFRPCILASIKQCTAPCDGRVSREDYAEQIKRLKQFLDSKGMVLRRELRAKMEQAAGDLNFERAAEYRDELRALENLQKRGLADEHVQPEVFYVDPAEGLERLGGLLDLEATPRTIEGIDIAHLQGKESCGSLVMFIDGKPFKNGYRRYKIKTVDGNDDFASIREVVWRRYKLAGMNAEIFPEIILIDGGKGQLAAAWSAFEGLEFRPPLLASLAKTDELIFVHGRDEPIKLKRNDPALRVLQSVRDEAHRFAQHYHHILRRKATLEK